MSASGALPSVLSSPYFSSIIEQRFEISMNEFKAFSLIASLLLPCCLRCPVQVFGLYSSKSGAILDGQQTRSLATSPATPPEASSNSRMRGSRNPELPKGNCHFGVFSRVYGHPFIAHILSSALFGPVGTFFGFLFLWLKYWESSSSY